MEHSPCSKIFLSDSSYLQNALAFVASQLTRRPVCVPYKLDHGTRYVVQGGGGNSTRIAMLIRLPPHPWFRPLRPDSSAPAGAVVSLASLAQIRTLARARSLRSPFYNCPIVGFILLVCTSGDTLSSLDYPIQFCSILFDSIRFDSVG